MPLLSIIIPTYNELENLGLLVERIKNALQDTPVEWEIIVVDDNSPDGTAQVAEELSKDFPLRLLVRKRTRGLSRSVLEGFTIAKGELLLVMDADLSHQPEHIPAMWDLMIRDSCDLVIGSRYVTGGTIKDFSILRKLTSKISKLLVYPLTRIKDPLAGFFLVRRKVIENRSFNPEGFKILLEILIKGQYERVREIPITFQGRVCGISKLSKDVVLKYLLQVMKLYIETVMSIFKSAP